MPYFNHAGLRLHYREHGGGSLVILLPGNTASSAHFANEIDRLSAAYLVVSLDLRGTGQSERLDQFSSDWQIQSAEDTAALIEHLGVERAVLIGTSGGAGIALLCAARHPKRVQAVVADSFVCHWTPDLLAARIAERETVSEMQAQFWAYGHGEDWQQVVDADTQWMRQQAENGGLNITSELTKVLCPVLLTGTLADSMLPDISSQMIAAAQVLSQPEMYLCKQGNHPLVWTAPDYFWTVSEPFLKRVLDV
jgi:pimeloyl-ACP methyl ester carboxylesterase